jgi:hypothetical protein
LFKEQQTNLSNTAATTAVKNGKTVINVNAGINNMVPGEPKPAQTAEDIDHDIEDVDAYDPNEELIDYNEVDPELILAATKAKTPKLELRDALTKNDLAMRKVLREEPMKAYYAYQCQW